MKKMLGFLLAVATLATTAQAQMDKSKDKDKKGRVIAAHFTYHDFQTAADLKASGLSQVLLDKQWTKTSRMHAGFAISDTRGLTPNIDLMSRFGGTSLENPVPGKTSDGTKKLYLEADMSLHLKLLSDNFAISPFISAGAGASVWGGYFGAYIPAGVGLQGHFGNVYAFLQAQYRFHVTQNVAEHLFYGIGIGFGLHEKKKAVVLPPPPPPPAPKDTDGDGIVDSLDACPTVAGLAQFQGCPDTDKDGIKDSEDKCPTTPGLARYNGCPIPDTDNDGINDEADKCPTVAGLAKYQGCPPPDRDGDGVIDEEDKCPDVAGPASNGGCPTLEGTSFDAKAVQFKTGTATLTPAAQKELNDLVTLLQDPKYAPIKVSIEGHTDNVGKPASNKTLSEKRAASVKAYLVKKGVNADRLSTVGFGDTAPVADNKTAAGKASNRRVEFKVSE